MAPVPASPPDDQLGFAFDMAPGALSGASPPAPEMADSARPHRAVTRGRTATRARTAVLFSRLEALGLRDTERVVLMRTRTVLVTVIGRTLRLHDDFADAPGRRSAPSWPLPWRAPRRRGRRRAT